MLPSILVELTMQSTKHKYSCHKGKAKKRQIPFELTFEEWYDIWQQSGKWEERGCKKGQYVMSRKGDIGPYTKENVFIQLHGKNVSEAQVGIKRPKRSKEHLDNFKKAYSLVPVVACPHCNINIKGKGNLFQHMRSKHEQAA